MAELTPELVESVWAACQAGAGEIGEALSRALDLPLEIEPGENAKCGPSRLPDPLAGPALVLILEVSGQAAVVVLPEATGVVPAWCADPDPTGRSKLATLAQELSMLCLPETVISETQQALRVPNARTAMAPGGLVNDGVLIPLHLRSNGENRGAAYLLWPLKNPANLSATTLAPTPAAPVAVKPQPTKSAPTPAPTPAPTTKVPPTHQPPDGLPPYTRSLLRIQVPVAVTLASKKQPVGRIVELGIGSIIHFNKKCEDQLDLEVNGCRIALGEPVKVGDKFGLRVTGVTLPPEEFKTLRRS